MDKQNIHTHKYLTDHDKTMNREKMFPPRKGNGKSIYPPIRIQGRRHGTQGIKVERLIHYNKITDTGHA